MVSWRQSKENILTLQQELSVCRQQLATNVSDGALWTVNQQLQDAINRQQMTIAKLAETKDIIDDILLYNDTKDAQTELIRTCHNAIQDRLDKRWLTMVEQNTSLRNELTLQKTTLDTLITTGIMPALVECQQKCEQETTRTTRDCHLVEWNNADPN
jgi:hypothetical protein